MQYESKFQRNGVRKAFQFVGSLVLGAALLTTPALARHKTHDPHRHRNHHHRQQIHVGPYGHPVDRHHGHRMGHGHGHYVAGHRPFVIPSRIAHTSTKVYRPYYRGRVYYRPHRHRHALYYFPIRTPAGWVERPYFYCEGALFDYRVASRGPSFSLSVGL